MHSTPHTLAFSSVLSVINAVGILVAFGVLILTGCDDDDGALASDTETVSGDLSAQDVLEDTANDAELEADVATADTVLDMATDTTSDAPGEDDLDASTEDETGDATGDQGDAQPPAYIRTYPLAADFPAPPGHTWRRSIIHLHSTHSHDACDNNPRPDGEYNLPCVADLRAALCTTRIDVANLTDHREHMGLTPFNDLLLHEPATDHLVERDSVVVANEIVCPDGFVVTTTVGMETDLLPVAFDGKLDPDPETNDALLGGNDAETADRFRMGGAMVWTAHTEGWPLERLRERQLDGLEIFNLHAAFDPRKREADLGLSGQAVVLDLLPFIMGETTTPPDLIFLIIHADHLPSLASWAALLEDGPIVGGAGTDAHQNAFRQIMIDGERIDSYRRSVSWFSNYVLTEDPEGGSTAIDSYELGLAAGRLFVAFDTLGSPAGFDASVVDSSDNRYEMGETLTFEAGMTVEVNTPALADSEPAPTIETRLYEVVDGNWEQVESAGAGAISWEIDAPGIYRVEVRMIPLHLAGLLDGLRLDASQVSYPWIYSNAWRVLE